MAVLIFGSSTRTRPSAVVTGDGEVEADAPENASKMMATRVQITTWKKKTLRSVIAVSRGEVEESRDK